MIKFIGALQVYIYLGFTISEGYRNNGYGTLLMDASKEWAKKHQSDYLRLSIIPANEAEIRFYGRNGLLEQMVTMECPIP